MKKTVFFMIMLAVLATGCNKNEKSKALNYNDSNPIKMVLRGEHQISVTSDYDISYTAINDDKEVITVTSAGKLYGKNVGTAHVKISNSHNEITVPVDVDLFTEPTFNFGCSTSKIKELYGQPIKAEQVNDTVLAYVYTSSQGYSYACGEMDFFFDEGAYYAANLYIKKSVEFMMNKYLDDNFNLYGHSDSLDLDIYINKLDNSIVCEKFDANNEWNEWCLFYYQIDVEKSAANFLKRRPRSSKLRY